MKLVFLGPPGAGKGTQAKLIAKQRSWAHISTGDMLRAAVKAGTPLGLQAKTIMDRGELIPDDLMCAVVADRLGAADCGQGFILDGFPRTRVQADRLDETLAKLKMTLDRCVYFHIDTEVLVARMTGRLTCRSCGANFHVTAIPPKVAGICDACGGELFQRDDDREETVRNRLQVYQRSTAELIDFYAGKGNLLRVDADGQVEEVAARLAAGLGDS
ncbi:MAG: adenylate kinase [Planctomycetes bacterium]|nr:adenylate kinase [Planctomycetota bacterium]